VQRLEYYDKESGQKPKAISDSLIKVFKTVNGREVIDARGIEPEITIKEKEYSRLTAMLVGNNLVFNYATDYFYNHLSIDEAGKFTLSDADYEAFKLLAIKDTFDYSTASEEMLKKMKETAEEEGYFEDAKAQYEDLMKKVVPSKERDLEKFKEEIKTIIENEIISRYYYQKGRTIDSFRNDDYLKKAIEILKNTQEYNTILKK
jgi:carboxyl-terminal processing protease